MTKVKNKAMASLLSGIMVLLEYVFFSFICFPFTRSMDMVHNAFEVERVQALRFIRKVCNHYYSGISKQASDYRSSTGWLLWSNSNLLALNKHFTVAYFCQVWPHFKILEKPGYCLQLPTFYVIIIVSHYMYMYWKCCVLKKCDCHSTFLWL